LQEIAAVERIVEMLPLAVAELPGKIVDAVDSALSTGAVRTLDRQQAHQPHAAIQFSQFHRGRQPGQSAADDHYTRSCHKGFRVQEMADNGLFVESQVINAIEQYRAGQFTAQSLEVGLTTIIT